MNGIPWSITEGRSIRLLEQTHVDAYFSFVDNRAARLCTNHLARELHSVVHVDVGTRIHCKNDELTMFADIRLFEPGVGRGCALCVPQLSPEQLDEAFYEMNAPSGSMHRGEPFQWNNPVHGRPGSLLLLNTMAASVAVQLWLSWLNGKTRARWLRMVWPFGTVPSFEPISITGVPGCAWCGNLPQ